MLKLDKLKFSQWKGARRKIFKKIYLYIQIYEEKNDG